MMEGSDDYILLCYGLLENAQYLHFDTILIYRIACQFVIVGICFPLVSVLSNLRQVLVEPGTPQGSSIISQMHSHISWMEKRVHSFRMPVQHLL